MVVVCLFVSGPHISFCLVVFFNPLVLWVEEDYWFHCSPSITSILIFSVFHMCTFSNDHWSPDNMLKTSSAYAYCWVSFLDHSKSSGQLDCCVTSKHLKRDYTEQNFLEKHELQKQLLFSWDCDFVFLSKTSCIKVPLAENVWQQLQADFSCHWKF